MYVEITNVGRRYEACRYKLAERYDEDHHRSRNIPRETMAADAPEDVFWGRAKRTPGLVDCRDLGKSGRVLTIIRQIQYNIGKVP